MEKRSLEGVTFIPPNRMGVIRNFASNNLFNIKEIKSRLSNYSDELDHKIDFVNKHKINPIYAPYFVEKKKRLEARSKALKQDCMRVVKQKHWRRYEKELKKQQVVNHELTKKWDNVHLQKLLANMKVYELERRLALDLYKCDTERFSPDVMKKIAMREEAQTRLVRSRLSMDSTFRTVDSPTFITN